MKKLLVIFFLYTMAISIFSQSQWDFSQRKDEITDDIIYTFSTVANTQNGEHEISLYIRCTKDNDELFINWNNYMGLKETEVYYRIDSNKYKRFTWTISTDSKATFFNGDDEDNVASFILKLRQAKKLTIRCTPYSENPVTVIFDLSDLKEITGKYVNILDWEKSAAENKQAILDQENDNKLNSTAN